MSPEIPWAVRRDPFGSSHDLVPPMPTLTSPVHLARVVWLYGTDPGVLSRTRRRDVIVSPEAD